jgi:hypothetical protein
MRTQQQAQPQQFVYLGDIAGELLSSAHQPEFAGCLRRQRR